MHTDTQIIPQVTHLLNLALKENGTGVIEGISVPYADEKELQEGCLLCTRKPYCVKSGISELLRLEGTLNTI